MTIEELRVQLVEQSEQIKEAQGVINALKEDIENERKVNKDLQEANRKLFQRIGTELPEKPKNQEPEKLSIDDIFIK